MDPLYANLDALRTRLIALGTILDGCITRSSNWFAEQNIPHWFAVLNLILGFLFPSLIVSEAFKGITEIIIAYCLFIAIAALSLLSLFWAGSYMTRQSQFKNLFTGDRFFRLLVKNYFYLASLSLTIATARLAAQTDSSVKGHVRVLDGVCCGVILITYTVVAYVGQVLHTGYEATVLTALLNMAFSFAMKFADQTETPVIFIVIASLVGVLVVIATDYCLPEDILLGNAEIYESLLHAAKRSLVRQFPMVLADFRQGAPLIPVQEGEGPVLVALEGPEAFEARLVAARDNLLNGAREFLLAEAERALLEVAPAAQADFTKAALAEHQEGQ